MFRQEFAAGLVSERKRLGLTAIEMATACGVKQATQYLYEKGERAPNADYINKAFQIGVEPSVIFSSINSGDRNAGSITFDSQSLKTSFIETDQACRDESAQLQDLEVRLRFFVERINAVAKRKSSNGGL